jgi:hypothetical protein
MEARLKTLLQEFSFAPMCEVLDRTVRQAAKPLPVHAAHAAL